MCIKHLYIFIDTHLNWKSQNYTFRKNQTLRWYSIQVKTLCKHHHIDYALLLFDIFFP